MSEENNEKSSKIKSDEGMSDDSSPMPTSENEKDLSPSTSMSQDGKLDSSLISIKYEKSSSLPTGEEDAFTNANTMSNRSDSSRDVNPSEIQTSDSKIRSSIILSTATATSEYSDSKTRSSIILDTGTATSEYTTGTSFTLDESYESNWSDGSNYVEIEEAVLKMIQHIEREIKSEEHVEWNENHFQNIELNIKTSRVLAAIEQTIQKLEIAFCLPYIFVENMNDMNVLCGDSTMSDLMHKYCKIRDAEDMDTCRFQPAVMNCINDAFEVGFSQFVDQHRRKLPETEAKFLSTMVQFKCMAEWQMAMSAIRAMNKEKTLHKMWTSNEKLKSKIAETEEQYESYRKKLQEMLNEKNKVIAAHNQTIADLEQRNANDINAEIFKSNKAMRRVCLTSEEKQKVLTAELQKIKETYEKLVQSNLIVEKQLRDQKSKTRQKLQAVLTKYDTGVGERFAELLRIRNELEEETLLYENKVKDFQLQEIEYNQIMADKAEVDAKIREEKLLLFMMNRSAKIIQRAYKKMMKKKKKGKKGKKGKKAKKAKK